MFRKLDSIQLCFMAIAMSTRLTAQNPVFNLYPKPIRATIEILAISSSTRQGFAGNQDTYLALVKAKDDRNLLIKLVDRYRDADRGVRRSVLEEHRLLRVQLIREDACDTPASTFHISSRSGDVFNPSSASRLQTQPSRNLSCFVMEHERTQLASRPASYPETEEPCCVSWLFPFKVAQSADLKVSKVLI